MPLGDISVTSSTIDYCKQVNQIKIPAKRYNILSKTFITTKELYLQYPTSYISNILQWFLRPSILYELKTLPHLNISYCSRL